MTDRDEPAQPSRVTHTPGASVSARVREASESPDVDLRPIALAIGDAPELAMRVEEIEEIAQGLLEIARRARSGPAIANIVRALPHTLRALKRAGLDGAAEDLETLVAEVETRRREARTANAEAAEHLANRARLAKLLDQIFAAGLDPRNPPRVAPHEAPETAYARALIERLTETPKP